MKSLNIQDVGPPLTDRDIEVAEQKLGVSLPPDYAAFLREHNGGQPEPSVFPISGFMPGMNSALTFLLGMRDEKYLDLLDTAASMKDRMPPDVLPIGLDPFGNFICLGVSGPNRGKVYWWFHEEEADEGELPGYDNIYFVAHSFTELLDNLTEPSEDA